MGITVGQVPNHYDVLGLTPAASAEEIEQAFARQLRRPRPFGEITQVSIAHEQLRDPVKRRAYDDSLGLNQPAKEVPPAPSDAIAVTRRRLFETAPTSVPQRAPAPVNPTPTERSTGAFIAASLRSAPEPHVSDAAEPPPAAEVVAPSVAEAREATAAEAAEPAARTYPYGELSFPAAQDAQIPWKGISIAIGAMIAAGGFLGAWVSPSAPEASEPMASKPAVTIPLPEATPATKDTTVAIPDRAPVRAKERSSSILAANDGESRLAGIEHALSDQPSAQPVEPADEAAADASVPVPAESVAQPAAMPLPGNVIARTIHQIGYSCGSVSSSTAVEGAAGVYKVTCTSGQSYRAAPVRGRYHFRRWNG